MSSRAIGTHASVIAASATPVVTWASPRSARRPARRAAVAPARPTTPNRPIAPFDSGRGADVKARARDDQSTLSVAKMSIANTARARSTGSSRTSDAIEVTSCRYGTEDSVGGTVGRARRSSHPTSDVRTAAAR